MSHLTATLVDCQQTIAPHDKHERDCFLLHVKAIKRSRGQRGEATGE